MFLTVPLGVGKEGIIVVAVGRPTFVKCSPRFASFVEQLV